MNKYTFSALILFLFIFSVEVNAQSKKYKTGKVKCEQASIINPGEFYSAYELEPADIEKLKELKFSDDQIATINQYCKESGWPTQLGNFDVRIENPEKLKTYLVYVVATFDGKYLLVAPAKYNQQLGDGWAPAQDIYFVVSTSGVAIKS